MTLNHSSDNLVARYSQVLLLTGRSAPGLEANAGLGAASARSLASVGAAGAQFLAPLLAGMERCDVEIRLFNGCRGGGLGTATLSPRV